MKIDEVLAQEAKGRLEAAIQIAGALAGAEFFMKATGAYNLGNVTEFMVKAMIVAKKAGLELVVWDDDFDENKPVGLAEKKEKKDNTKAGMVAKLDKKKDDKKIKTGLESYTATQLSNRWDPVKNNFTYNRNSRGANSF